MIALAVVNGADYRVYVETVQNDRPRAGHYIVPLGGGVAFRGELRKGGVSLVDKQTQRSHRHGLFHGFGYGTEHRIVPEIGAVCALNRIGITKP